eukprot:5633846-Pyramimonas_sp.AAC.1
MFVSVLISTGRRDVVTPVAFDMSSNRSLLRLFFLWPGADASAPLICRRYSYTLPSYKMKLYDGVTP